MGSIASTQFNSVTTTMPTIMPDMTLPRSPLASAAPVTIEEEVPVAELIASWQREFGIDITDEFTGVQKLSFCRCTRSQLGFFWPSVAGSAKIYAGLESKPWYYRSDQWEYTFALREAEPGARVLDLGCGTGAFVEMAEAAGLRAEGVDFNATAVANARAKGLDVSCASWIDLAIEKPGSYDLVTAFQLLEHLAEPLPFLQSAVELTRPGGRLLLAVPDADGWLSRTSNLLDRPPHHVLRWNPAAMQFLTEILPLELEKIIVEPLDPVHVRGFVGAYIHPRVPMGKRPSFIIRGLARSFASVLSVPAIRKRFQGQSMIAVFRRRPGVFPKLEVS